MHDEFTKRRRQKEALEFFTDIRDHPFVTVVIVNGVPKLYMKSATELEVQEAIALLQEAAG